MRKASKRTRRVPGIDAKNGLWRYRIRIGGGRRVVISTGLKATRGNLAVAKRLLDEHKARLLLGRREPGATEKISFEEASEKFLEHKRAKHRDKPATAKRIQASLSSWQAFMERRVIRTWTRGDVLDYMTWRRKTGRLEVTIRKDIHAGRQLARFALAHGWLKNDPFADVDVPSDRDSVNEMVLTREEVDGYLRVADCHHSLGDLARLIVNQGIRPDCEGLQIRADDVDLERGLLYIRNSKTRTGRRSLRLTEESKDVFARRIAAAPGPWVFPGRVHVAGPVYRETADRPLTYSAITGAHERALKKAEGVPPFVLYSLRHTFATWFYDSTKDLVALKEVLGHSDLRTVLRYVNDSQSRMDSAMKRFENGTARRSETTRKK